MIYHHPLEQKKNKSKTTPLGKESKVSTVDVHVLQHKGTIYGTEVTHLTFLLQFTCSFKKKRKI